MSYLPLNQCLIIAGGRNDEECKNLNTPFLDDVYLFLLDQKAWLPVKYTPLSQRIYRLGHHTMCTLSDDQTYEKVIIFGGLTYSATQEGGREMSHLSNDMYVLEIR